MSIFDGLADVFAESLGEPVIYTPVDGDPRTINAIWIVDAVTVGMPGGPPAADNRVVAHVRSADVPSLVEGDIIQRGDERYRVVPPFLPDGHGMTSIMLERLAG